MERQSVQLVRREEDAVLKDAVEREIGPHLGLVDVVVRLPDLLGVELPVRRREREASLFRVDELLHARGLAARLRRRRRDHVGQELQRILRRLRHPVGQDVGGVRRETEEVRPLRAQLREPLHDRLRVVRPAVVAPGLRNFEDPLSQGAVRERGEDGLLRRVLEVEDPLALEPALLRPSRGRREIPRAQSGELCLVRDDDGRGLRVGEQELREPRREPRLLLVQGAELRLVAGAELGAGAHEAQVVPVEEIPALRVEAESVALVVQRLHARVQLRVQVDRVLVLRELRGLLGADLLDRVVRVRGREVEEHLRDPREERSGALHGLERVREGGRRRVVRDRVDLRDLLLHALFDRGRVVGVPDLVEWRSFVWKRALPEERVRLGRGGGPGENECHAERRESPKDGTHHSSKRSDSSAERALRACG